MAFENPSFEINDNWTFGPWFPTSGLRVVQRAEQPARV